MICEIVSLLFAAVLVDSAGSGPCLYDGHIYEKGAEIIIPHCLASMECEGNNEYKFLEQLEGICPQKRTTTNGQLGCLFDGKVYSKGEHIVIQPCLAEMTCMGHNMYTDIVHLDGLSKDGICRRKRDTSTTSGCWFESREIAQGDQITIQPCISNMTCLGNNVFSDPVPLWGNC